MHGCSASDIAPEHYPINVINRGSASTPDRRREKTRRPSARAACIFVYLLAVAAAALQ